MARVRLGVALLLPEPTATEVDGLRRACVDGALGRVPPHITLVPPVNVRLEDLGVVLAAMRGAAAAVDGSLNLVIGPPATFHPVTPVVFLSVGGDLDGLGRLRDGVFVGPLARSLTWPFVPHVTLVDGIDEQLVDPTVRALHGYQVPVALDRLHLLQERKTADGRVWRPIADAPFEAPLVVGRGGLPVELSRSSIADPEVAPLFAEMSPLEAVAGGDQLVVAARRGADVLGAARAVVVDGTVVDVQTVATEAAGVEDVDHHLRRALDRR